MRQLELAMSAWSVRVVERWFRWAHCVMRQIAGAFAEYEKARLVGKLKGARDRIRKERGNLCQRP